MKIHIIPLFIPINHPFLDMNQKPQVSRGILIAIISDILFAPFFKSYFVTGGRAVSF